MPNLGVHTPPFACRRRSAASRNGRCAEGWEPRPSRLRYMRVSGSAGSLRRPLRRRSPHGSAYLPSHVLDHRRGRRWCALARRHRLRPAAPTRRRAIHTQCGGARRWRAGHLDHPPHRPARPDRPGQPDHRHLQGARQGDQPDPPRCRRPDLQRVRPRPPGDRCPARPLGQHRAGPVVRRGPGRRRHPRLHREQGPQRRARPRLHDHSEHPDRPAQPPPDHDHAVRARRAVRSRSGRLQLPRLPLRHELPAVLAPPRPPLPRRRTRQAAAGRLAARRR